MEPRWESLAPLKRGLSPQPQSGPPALMTTTTAVAPVFPAVQSATSCPPRPPRHRPRPPAGPHQTGSVPTAPPRSGWSDYSGNSGRTRCISYTGRNEQSPSRKGTDPGRQARAYPTGSVPTAPLHSVWSDYSDDSGCNGFTSYTGCNDRSPRAQRDRPRPTKGSSSNGVCPHTTTAARSERLRRRQWLQRFYQLHRLQRAVPSAAKGRTPGATSGPPANGVCPHSTNKVRLERLQRQQWLHRFYRFHRLQRAAPPAAKGQTPADKRGPIQRGLSP